MEQQNQHTRTDVQASDSLCHHAIGFSVIFASIDEETLVGDIARLCIEIIGVDDHCYRIVEIDCKTGQRLAVVSVATARLQVLWSGDQASPFPHIKPSSILCKDPSGS